MKLINFSFTKISAERKADTIDSVKVNSKIDIADIKFLEEVSTKEGEKAIRVNFSCTLEYSPNIAVLEFKGKITLVGETKQIQDIQEKWKEKKLSEDFRILLFNLILRKSNIKAIALEDELKLPLHVSLPTIKKQDK